MTYSIVVTGQGADPEDVKEVFENLIRGLRLISADQTVGGSASGTEGTTSFSYGSDSVEDLDDTDDLSDEPGEVAGPNEDDPEAQEEPIAVPKED